MTHRMRAWLAAALLGIAATVAPSSPSDAQGEISGGVVKLGVLTDETGVFSSLSGEGSIEATRMAVEDFGGKAAGKPIEIIHADHQNKTDIGAAIARRWIDVDSVDVIIDVPNSAIVLAVQQLAKEKNRSGVNRRDGRSYRQSVLAGRRALDLGYLCVCRQLRQVNRTAGRRQLVLLDRGFRLRPRNAARRHSLYRGGRRLGSR